MEGLDKLQIKGIDLAVKTLSKKYPFITGWGEYDKWEDFNVRLFINIKISPKLLAEYVNGEPEKVLPSSGESIYLQDFLEYRTFDWEQVKDLNNNIQEDLEKAYEFLPDMYKLKYELFSSSYDKILGVGNYSI